jgi:prepilin-type N-terminal cleavage/methylation domain-containing protein
MKRAAVSLIEVLIAVTVLALLAVALYGLIASSARGIAVDRLTEAKRFVIADLLERFAQPGSDLASLIKDSETSRELTIDEALRYTALAKEEADQVKAILTVGDVLAFQLTWMRNVDDRGTGPRSMTLHSLRCTPVLKPDTPGPNVDSYRYWAQRGLK